MIDVRNRSWVLKVIKISHLKFEDMRVIELFIWFLLSVKFCSVLKYFISVDVALYD